MRSYLSHLQCTDTGETYSADEPHSLSPGAQKVLYPRYDLDAARREVDRASFAGRPRGMWRYFELMPVRDESNVVTLGEGSTPMLRARNLERALDAGRCTSRTRASTRRVRSRLAGCRRRFRAPRSWG